MHMADPALAETAHRDIGEIAFVKDAARRFNERAARHRGVRLFAEALDQLHVEAPLELADLQADGRLRQVEMTRGGRKAAALDHLEQGAQLVEAEAAHQSAPYQND